MVNVVCFKVLNIYSKSDLALKLSIVIIAGLLNLTTDGNLNTRPNDMVDVTDHYGHWSLWSLFTSGLVSEWFPSLLRMQSVDGNEWLYLCTLTELVGSPQLVFHQRQQNSASYLECSLILHTCNWIYTTLSTSVILWLWPFNSSDHDAVGDVPNLREVHVPQTLLFKMTL